MKGKIMGLRKAFKRVTQSVKKAIDPVRKVASKAAAVPVKTAEKVGQKIAGAQGKALGRMAAMPMRSALRSSGMLGPMEAAKESPGYKAFRSVPKAIKKFQAQRAAMKQQEEDQEEGTPATFKKGGMAMKDKVGRAMKKTTADAKGRAMTKAPKKMMGGGMMKGYAGGGDVTCGKATRGYGAARKGK